MTEERILEEKFSIEKDITERSLDYKKWYAKVKYGVEVSEEGELGDLQKASEWNANFNKANTPDILTIGYSDIFDEGYMQWQVYLIDYRNMGEEDMGGWAFGTVRTKTGKSIRVRKDWRLPHNESFDMTEQVKDAKKYIKETIIKILIEAIDEKVDSGIDLSKYDH